MSGSAKVQVHDLPPWNFSTRENHILVSLGSKRETFESSVDLPNVPEMIFDDNIVCLALSNSKTSAKICFTALEALKLVDKKTVSVEIPAAKEWRETHLQKYSVFRPFDWTFSTTYTGSISGSWKIEETTEGLDYEFLRSRLPILLYADVNLFEDELGDNGISVLNVKIRVMPRGFFVLQRFFLRVDGALLRVWDTRLQWRKGDGYVLRDIKRSDSVQWLPGMAGVGINDAEAHCTKLIEHRTEKLIPLDFPFL
uniref:TIP41-like protein n=1 Tax=Schistocephalus solidus TaxID=70667 RepID=A0A0X3PBI4_SCHSO